MGKPKRLLDRDHQWVLLNDFLADPAPELRLAIVSGRRRNGKSFLLEALTEAVGGLYLTAVQEEGRVPALHRFTEAIAAHASAPPRRRTYSFVDTAAGRTMSPCRCAAARCRC